MFPEPERVVAGDIYLASSVGFTNPLGSGREEANS
jgi:hypothetical protein